MKSLLTIFLLFAPLMVTASEQINPAILGEWLSGRPHWADYLNILPDGTARGIFPVEAWARSRPIVGTWTRTGDDSVKFTWSKPFGPREAKFMMESGKPVLLSIEKYGNGITTLPMHRRADILIPKDEDADTPRMSRIYPVGHSVKLESEKRVTVLGMIRYPGLYYLDASWDFESLMELCCLMPLSYKRIQLQRSSDGTDKQYYLNLRDLKESKKVFEIKDGDVYFIDHMPFYNNAEQIAAARPASAPQSHSNHSPCAPAAGFDVLPKMRCLIPIAILLALAACDRHKQQLTSSIPNPDTPMKVGDLVPDSMLYGDPPDSPDPTQNLFFGLKDGDKGHKLYAVSTVTPISQIVRDFQIGSHGAESYSWDVEETIHLVAEKADAIASVIPCRVTFADPAGLKLRFLRQVTEADMERIKALFSEDDMMQAGLEGYLSEWDGEGSPLSRIAEENLIHLWWD